MTHNSAASGALASHLALLSLISFGGIPTVLPDLHNFLAERGWLSDRDFVDCFAVVQAIPGPNMILMMSLIGWKIGGLGAAIAGGLAIFMPSCATCLAAYCLWDRFREARWQQMARRGLAPITIGLIVAGGVVMAGAADRSWPAAGLTGMAAALLLASRINPLWTLAAGGALGALGIL